MSFLIRPRDGGLLFIRGGAIGDFVLTLPALRLARRSFPGQLIEVLGTPGVVELAGYFGVADGVGRLEDPALARFFVPGGRQDDRWCAYFRSFSVVVSYLFDPDDIFHDNLRRAGVATLVRGPHRPADGGGSAAEQLAGPLAGLAVFPDADDLDTPMIGRAALPPEALIAVHPGSGSPRKNWGLENWVRVAADAQHRTGATILVVAGEAEAAVVPELRRMLEAAGVRNHEAIGLSLTDLADRLAGCRQFFGHDSGPGHLAAACGVPCLLVFGPTDPAVWAPAGRHVRVVRAAGGSLAAVSPDEVIAIGADQRNAE